MTFLYFNFYWEAKLTILKVQLGLIMSSSCKLPRFKLRGRTDASCELWWFDAFKEQIRSRHYSNISGAFCICIINTLHNIYCYTVDMRILILHVLAWAVCYCIFHVIQQIHHNLTALSQYYLLVTKLVSKSVKQNDHWKFFFLFYLIWNFCRQKQFTSLLKITVLVLILRLIKTL